jgi:hypothetical protein
MKPRRRAKRAPGRVKREKSISALTKELDALVSRSVRLSAMDKNGMVECYTCGHRVHYKKIHCGHYIMRFFRVTRWDRKNLRPQCYLCNIYRKGNAVIFRRKLVLEYGDEVVKQMEDSVDLLIRGGLSREYLEKCIEIEKKSLELLERQLSTEMNLV